MRIVVALGGNALLRRGEAMTPQTQRRNVRDAAAQLARVAPGNELVIVHGNGPQVGLLAALGASAPPAQRFSLDVLDAQTEGMIGYLIELELRNQMHESRACATLLTMVEVDRADAAFARPDKPVGAILTRDEASAAAQAHGWSVAADGNGFRRVVPSPAPQRFLQLDAVRALLAQGSIVICAGGGGVPVVRAPGGQYDGVEAVVDKDRSAALLARAIEADLFVIATDVDGVYLDWGTPHVRRVRRAHPDALAAYDFAAGSMGPKVEAASDFARSTGRRASIGALADIARLAAGTAGTSVQTGEPGIVDDATGVPRAG
ncbi:carbamate kinase [Paraburkholderia unamae]|uniref:Carbamate kinase n=1 Tax=Paraburkholderia unamae TaxID=219649 RepID=A0ABX5KCA2_9BURK|nr:carbamate kinase [Paraburkholderia unamae]PVX61147.1 carbamate kinase [Paraburkholderia unamae]RAR48334.1 carbamate kinase [Paraburkholderia unamae]